MQVTIPINPGNSGGPIFDSDGQVVAIATFIIRQSQDKRTLEGLNFGLEVSFLHELLQDSGQSLNSTEIAELLSPKGFSGARDILLVKGTLLSSDPIDPLAVANCYHRVHTCKMTAGHLYQIDLVSTWDNYLRLEDSTGLNLREDDDSGGDLNARIVFFPTRTDSYRIIVTSYQAFMHGPYLLRVQEK